MIPQEKITVDVVINAPIEKAWKFYTAPEHVIHWNNASDGWHTPKAVNDLRKGGKFSYRMEAKDGSAGFDFSGMYEEVRQHELIEYSLGDARKVKVIFSKSGAKTMVVVTFDAETENSVELQRKGWQAILNNFKKYTESN
ncbi:MAG: Activator of Hsp90 ATPase 1 family protein [archaeon GW2011_AR3]|nr:MAG: Activator of Hsp90 ATPase 1 family protein [archaeon GW2011_AR3]MBS3110166.1 SRPBCC family protein [Candidatus Woesearchaeota archaeon]